MYHVDCLPAELQEEAAALAARANAGEDAEDWVCEHCTAQSERGDPDYDPVSPLSDCAEEECLQRELRSARSALLTQAARGKAKRKLSLSPCATQPMRIVNGCSPSWMRMLEHTRRQVNLMCRG